jgi:CheY-like chemotaxis protein
MKYLIVDDSIMGRNMIAKQLKELKYYSNNDEIFFAKNGVEAIEQYKLHKPNICFMDLTMPIMGGFEATKEIVSFDQNAKIIVVSADIQKLAQEKAAKLGALGFIVKPVTSEHLIKIIEHIG